MARSLFYLRYAWQNLRGSHRWTVFAVLSVAAGVATVVALYSLGLSISDALLVNLRQINRGDITISRVSTGPFAFTTNQGDFERQVFSTGQIERITTLAQAYSGHVALYSIYNNVQVRPYDMTRDIRPQFVTSLFIDPAAFTQSHDIRAVNPPGASLAELLRNDWEIVISENLAQDQGIGLGDAVRVTGTEDAFFVSGIVATETEANIRNMTASFFGFAYFRQGAAPLMQFNSAPNHISIVLPDGTAPETIRQFGVDLWQLNAGIYSMNTTPDLLERNTEIADLLSRFIVVLGLGALLIGGVGIVNTMLVMVGRRTFEIASLKTFGMRRYQIAVLFSTEALLLGLAGSVLGSVAGVGLSVLVNQYGELLIRQSLTWRLHPEAVWFGFGLGLVVTFVFGVLPVSIAARVRPALILRPDQTYIQRASWPEVLAAVGVLVVVLGVIAGQIIGPLFEYALADRTPDFTLVGMAVVAAALFVLAVLVVILWVLVWVIGRLPAWGHVELRLALRNLTAHRVRTATTLLALSTGMFALSSISFFGLGARQMVQFQFAETLGGNVLVVPLIREGLGATLVDFLVAAQSDIQHTTRMGLTITNLTAVDNKPLYVGERSYQGVSMPTVIRETDKPGLRSGTLLAGRDLSPEDYGQPVVVLSQQSLLESTLRDFTLGDLGVGVGTKVTLQIRDVTRDFEVVGIVSSASGVVPNFGSVFIPPGIVDARRVYGHAYVLDVPTEQVNGLLSRLSAVPLVLAADVTFVDNLLAQLVEQMSAIPTVVGGLSLVAAAVIMGNTVSLAALERRQQIGVLKAMGLSRRRVLGVLLIENTLVGLLGGLLGIGLSALVMALVTALGTGVIVPVPDEARPVVVGLLVAALLIAWAATFFSARLTVNEKAAQVLRYE